MCFANENEVHTIASNKDKVPSSQSWSNRVPRALPFPLVGRWGNSRLKSEESCPLCWRAVWILASPMTGQTPGGPCGDPQVVSVATQKHAISDRLHRTPPPTKDVSWVISEACTPKHAGTAVHFHLVTRSKHTSIHSNALGFRGCVGNAWKCFTFSAAWCIVSTHFMCEHPVFRLLVDCWVPWRETENTEWGQSGGKKKN